MAPRPRSRRRPTPRPDAAAPLTAGATPAPGTRSRPLRERVGAAGEAAALELLRARGLDILEVDWRSPLGQVDVVAQDGDSVVIVEVKSRRGLGFGLPVEGVDARKRRKLRQLAYAYMSASGRSGGAVRIDIIGLLLDSSLRVVEASHLESAVGEAG